MFSQTIKYFSHFITRLYQAIEDFWFAPRDLIGLAVMRILVASSMAYLAITRHSSLDILFSKAHSMVPLDIAPKMIPEYYRPTFFYYIWSDLQLPWVHLTYIFLLILLALGFSNRLLMVLTWLLHVGFMQRNFSVVFGADLIGGLWLFYLAWTQANQRLSLWNYIQTKLGRVVKLRPPDILTNASVRMMQLQLCVIYAYTGWEKLKGKSWWEGTSLWSVLGNPQMALADFSPILQFPWIIALMVYSTLIFEIYFPLLVFNERWRKPTLIVGILFHFGIGISMKGLWPFSLIMLAAYPLFTRYSLRVTR